MKRAFGFAPESEEEEGEYDPTLPTYAVANNAAEESEEAAEHSPAAPTPPEIEVTPQTKTAKKRTSTAHNNQDIDPTLPQDLFDAVIQLFNEQQPEFVKKCLSTEAQRKYIIGALTDNLKKRLSVDAAERESLRKENRRLQLSVDRQKRALLDRINDLESQVARYNDEKEKLFTQKKRPADSEQLDKANDKVAELEGKLNEQDNIRKQLEVKVKMGDTMLNELRNKYAATKRELEQMQQEQESAMSNIQDQLNGFEQLKAKKNAKIAELEKALAEKNVAATADNEVSEELEKRIADLTAENESLHRTIENNLYNQANIESGLRNEIKRLQAELNPDASNAKPDESPADDRPSRKRGRPRKVRIDTSLDNTEWFASNSKDAPDFGYQEPPHRPVNDNEAQLSLF
ncbi:MAG: hypothetical protein NC221_00750 [Duncaniella sp.]|nr:hypothetical protein [Duncaniella sp.]